MRVGKGGILLYANKASAPLLKQWGCKKGGTLPSEWKKRIDKALSSLGPFSADESSGKRIYAMDIVPIKDADYANVYCRDITERKQVEEILRENEERLMILFEFAPDAYYISDLKGNFVDGNKAAEELIGYNRNELIGKNFLKLKILYPKQIKKAAALLAKNIMRKSTGPDEFVLNRKNGSQVTVEIRTHPVKIHNKTLVLGIARDITDRKLAEEQLRMSEERYRTVAEYTYDWEYWLAPDGKIAYLSPSCERITGYSAGEFMEKPDLLESIVHPDDIHLFKEHKTRSAQNEAKKKVHEADFRILRRDGEIRWIGHTCRTIRRADGTSLGLRATNRDITDRKLTEEALTISEEKFIKIFQSSPDAILLTSVPEGKVIEMNDSVIRITGYTAEEMLGRTTHELGLWAVPSARDEYVARVRRDGRVTDFETDFRTKSGAVITGLVSGEIIRLRTGPCFLSIVRDITERKRAEEELTKSEGKFRAIFDNASDGMFLVDLKARKFFMCNTVCIKMLGYAQEEFSNLDIADIHNGEDLPFIYEQIGKFSRGEEGIRSDIRFKRKDGSTFAADLSPALLTIAEKTYLLIIFKDITERRRAEEALRKSEERFRLAVNATEEGLWEWDILSGQEFFSPRWCEIIGYSFDDPELSHTYNSWAERIHPDDSERVSRVLKSHLEEGTKYDVDYQHRHKSGEYRWQNSKGQAIFDERGKPTKMVGCISDITERRRAEEKLKFLLKEKEVLVREVHHRVKNNFTVVSSLLNLQSQQIEDENIQNMFMKSRDRIRSMSLIHERLYQSQDLIHINFTEYIGTLAADLYDAYETDPAKISLVVEAEDVSLNVDQAIPCGLIVNELISNALKYGFPHDWKSKGEIKVTLRRIYDDNEIELAVKDNGVGLPDDFDIEKTKSLGLKIITLLVEDQLGGKLKVVKDAGTGFIVRFNIDK
jgi:PAS domain S-box-containing protein